MNLGPYELNRIYTGDARELGESIPDNSIDLIFTDPVYSQIEDYEWLAKTAARVLKDNSPCLVWCSVSRMAEVENIFKKYMNFRWWIPLVMYGGGAKLFSRNMLTKWTPLLWTDNGEFYPHKEIVDIKTCYYGATKFPDTAHYKWAKHPDFLIEYLQAFTQPDSIVFDPFTGGGSVPAVCKMLGRNYLAFEIDEATADKARERVLLTQPPLFVPQPNQLTLEGIANA